MRVNSFATRVHDVFRGLGGGMITLFVVGSFLVEADLVLFSPYSMDLIMPIMSFKTPLRV